MADTWDLKAGGVEHSYDITAARDVSVGISSVNGVPESFGMSLYERGVLTSADLEMVYLFLGAAHPGVPISSEIQYTIAANVELDLTQICWARPIEFGLLKIWAGTVGNQIVLVGKDCPRP